MTNNLQRTKNTRFFTSLVIFSLVGQIAWVVENMYFNVFIYKMFGASPSDIALMVSASAVSATLTTLIIGALSDKLGKRKIFICAGYILWGVSILSFALIRTDIMSRLFGVASAGAVCITLVIIMDCVMTFFGSSANDACFNAWLTDVTTEKNRGRAEGINSMMPLVAILCVFGGFMGLDQSKRESWTAIFLIIGAVVVAIGIAGLFLIFDPKIETGENKSYFKNILYGFRPSVIKKNPILYLMLLGFAIFGISIQIFMPYLIIYYEKSLEMTNYVFIMAPAIVLASVFTALWGRAYDKLHFKTSITASIALLCVGYIVLIFARHSVPVFIGSLLMMCGYLSSMAVFGASIRDNTPENKSGMFQGLRIVAQVLIPGVVGPMIGKALLSDAQIIVNGDGTTSFLPNEKIFIGALAVCAVLVAFLVPLFLAMSRLKKPRVCQLYTKASEGLDISAWNEYPRPQLKRDSYFSLNGEWELKINDSDTRKIIVPFAPESVLSGVGEEMPKGAILYYKKAFKLPSDFAGERVILHLGAIDQIARVAVNGSELGAHRGGYLPFSFDITEHLKDENIIEIYVTDELENHILPYGKQKRKRGGMWYTPISGIWQSVWLEGVPEEYIKSIKIETGSSGVQIFVEGVREGKVILRDTGEEYAIFDGKCEILVENPHTWSPKDPYLYYFDIITAEDKASSYFALRALEVKEIDGVPRILLNGEPLFFHALLDQGYFSDGIYTPATPKEYERDILSAKALGFNTLRKHIKIEPELFYYYCDLHGMIVFQDMINNGKYSFIRDTALPTVGIKKRNDTRLHKDKATREAFEAHMREAIKALYNHPCICYWTIFNEGWGQFESAKMYEIAKSLDKTRIIDTASGWFEGAPSDVTSPHIYFKRVKIEKSDKPIILSEFGGYSCKIKGHSFNLDKTYGYRFFEEKNTFMDALEALYRDEIIPLIEKGLCGAVYTQLTDVEDETNGLITYDRKIVKVDSERMLRIASELKI